MESLYTSTMPLSEEMHAHIFLWRISQERGVSVGGEGGVDWQEKGLYLTLLDVNMHFIVLWTPYKRVARSLLAYVQWCNHVQHIVHAQWTHIHPPCACAAMYSSEPIHTHYVQPCAVSGAPAILHNTLPLLQQHHRADHCMLYVCLCSIIYVLFGRCIVFVHLYCIGKRGGRVCTQVSIRIDEPQMLSG